MEPRTGSQSMLAWQQQHVGSTVMYRSTACRDCVVYEYRRKSCRATAFSQRSTTRRLLRLCLSHTYLSPRLQYHELLTISGPDHQNDVVSLDWSPSGRPVTLLMATASGYLHAWTQTGPFRPSSDHNWKSGLIACAALNLGKQFWPWQLGNVF